MKNYALTLLLTAVIVSCQQKRPASVEKPVFETWSSDVLEVEKVETSDTATILHLDAFFRPGWWIKIAPDSYIKESGTNNKLMLTKAEGINPGEKHWMPDSGKSSFTLYFPPLDPDVTKIDFIESDCEDCFKIWGISLLSEASVETQSMSPFTEEETMPVPDPAYSDQPAKISGRLSGFNKSMLPYEITFHSADLVASSFNETKLNVNEDGSFSREVPVNTPSIVYSDRFGPFFLAPGQQTEIYVDLRKKARYESRYRKDKQPGDSIYVYTSGSPVTPAQITEINQINKNLIDQTSLMEEIAGMSTDAYKEFMIDKWHSAKQQIEAENLNAAQKKILSGMVQFRFLQYLLFYSNYLKQAHFTVNDIPFEEWRESDFQIEEPDKDYYSFIQELVTDDLSVDGNFGGVVNRIYTLPVFMEAGNNLTGIDKAVAIGNKLEQSLNEKSELVIEAAKAQILYQELQKPDFFTEEEKQELQTLFVNDAISNQLIAENDELKKIIEANKAASGDNFVIHEIPDVAQNKVFDAILAEYKGKSVVVDFWATWCAPCRSAMEQMKPLKEEMKDEGVVFVYLTGETSPNGTWNKMIPEIHGHHYRVSDEQWQYWYENLKIEGVPTFMIFNKNGEQTARYTGFPGVDTIRNAITGG
jgi:thiol-disulfide isomerase/thioredoxin